MMPYSLTFRRLLKKYIPQLTDEEIDRHESLLALRTHLLYESNSIPPGIPAEITQISEEANRIIEPVAEEFTRTVQLWSARRELALEQRYFRQIAPTARGVWQHFRKYLHYQRVQIPDLTFLWRRKFLNSAKQISFRKMVAISIPTILVAVGLLFFLA